MATTSVSTRRTIAREAGLSPTTVSLVLNNRADAAGIRPQTQQRVWEVARRLNYTPNPLAVGLNGGRTSTIGLLWSLGGPHAAETMSRTITLAMQRHGYVTHLSDHMSDISLTTKLLVEFSRRRVDAIIMQADAYVLETPRILQLLNTFPAVLIVGDAPPSEGMTVDHLYHDRLPAYAQAADHFASIGRRRPAILGSFPGARRKAEAFLGQGGRRGMSVSEDAMIDLHVPPGERLSDACWAMLEKRFAGREFPFDALMCINDECAIVVMDFLRRRGVRVPQDVAVAGFNNGLAGPYQVPPLASGDRRDEEVAVAIEEMIFARLEQPDLPSQRRHITARFLWRESAGGEADGSADPAGRGGV